MIESIINIKLEQTEGVTIFFKPDIAYNKPLLILTLILNDNVLDCKIVPMDIFSCTFSMGLYDLKEFC